MQCRDLANAGPLNVHGFVFIAFVLLFALNWDPSFVYGVAEERCPRLLARLMPGAAARCTQPYPHRFVLFRPGQAPEELRKGTLFALWCLPW